MAKLIHGDRVGRLGQLMVGSCAVIYDSQGRVLLTRRTDNNRWCLPGGRQEPGESVSEACAREVLEETGLAVDIGRLAGVYTTPHMLIEYPDGNRVQPVSFVFEAVVTGGELRLSDETTEFGYYGAEAFDSIDLMEHHRERIADALSARPETIVR